MFYPTSNKICRGKTSNFDYRRQSEARNFETAEHIDKQKTYLVSTINALQNGTKLGGITPRCSDVTCAEN